MSMSPQATLKTVTTGQHHLELTWSDDKVSRFHFLWLRDNCPSTLHPDTRERVFNQLSVSADIHPIEYNIQDNKLLIQ